MQKHFVKVRLLRARTSLNEVHLHLRRKRKCGSLTMERVAEALVAVVAGLFAVVALFRRINFR